MRRRPAQISAWMRRMGGAETGLFFSLKLFNDGTWKRKRGVGGIGLSLRPAWQSENNKNNGNNNNNNDYLTFRRRAGDVDLNTFASLGFFVDLARFLIRLRASNCSFDVLLVVFDAN